MQVKMLVGLSGGVTLAPGDIHNCSAAEGKRLIDAGFAEAISATAQTETAVKKVAKEVRAKKTGA